MTGTPAHDWLRPRLDQVLADAEAHGIARDVAVAVINDIVTDVDFGSGHVASDTDA